MDINVVVKLALDKCISIYNEMASEKLEMGESVRIYGRIPKVLIIKYGDGYLKRGDLQNGVAGLVQEEVLWVS